MEGLALFALLVLIGIITVFISTLVIAVKNKNKLRDIELRQLNQNTKLHTIGDKLGAIQKSISGLSASHPEVKVIKKKEEPKKIDTAEVVKKEKEKAPEKPVKKEEMKKSPIESYLSEMAHAKKAQKPVLKKAKKVSELKRDRSEFEKKAYEILKRIWQYVLFGSHYKKEGMSAEFAVATTWLIRSAVIIIVLGIGFFLKYSISRNWINEIGRVTLSILSGLTMVGIGTKLSNKKYNILGQGLLGGGIAVLYFSVFAAYEMYNLILQIPALALAVVITIAACALAVRLDSLLVAVLGVIGGYFTPVFLGASQANLTSTFTYILLLGIGVLAIARHKNWRLLNFLSFLFTYGLASAELFDGYTRTDFALFMTFFSLFYLLFSCIPIIYNIRHREKSTILELAMMGINAAIYFAVAYGLIDDLYSYRWTAIVSICLASCYILQVFLFLEKKIKDRNLLIILCGFASLFIALTIPLVLSKAWITMSWAILALVFFWMSKKIGSNFLQTVSYILYTVTFVRLLGVDMEKYFIDINTKNYIKELLSRFSSMGMFVISLGGAFYISNKYKDRSDTPTVIHPDNDIKFCPDQSILAEVLFWFTFVGTIIFLHFELYYLSMAYFPSIRVPLLSMISLGGMIFVFYRLIHTKKQSLLYPLILLMGVIVVKSLSVDLNIWGINTRFLFHAGTYYPFVHMGARIWNFVLIIGAFVWIYFGLLKLSKDKTSILSTAQFFGIAALSILFGYLTLEINTLFHYFIPGAQHGAVSVLWGIFALTFILAGIRKQMRSIRYTGLILFAVTVTKIFIVDTARLSQVYRIFAFIILGLVCLVGGFLYLKFRETFVLAEHPSEGDSDDKE